MKLGKEEGELIGEEARDKSFGRKLDRRFGRKVGEGAMIWGWELRRKLGEGLERKLENRLEKRVRVAGGRRLESKPWEEVGNEAGGGGWRGRWVREGTGEAAWDSDNGKCSPENTEPNWNG